MPEAAAFWNRRADKYAQQPIKDQASYEKTLERARAHLEPTDRALEIGCGTGTTALKLAPSVARLVASDVASRMVEIGAEKAATQGVENVEFACGTVFDDAFEKASFDAVLAFNLLHLVDDLEAVLARVHALLKPGRRFVSKTVCLGEGFSIWRPMIAVMRPLGLAPYVRILKTAELEGLIARAGFEVLETGSFPASPVSRFVAARKI